MTEDSLPRTPGATDAILTAFENGEITATERDRFIEDLAKHGQAGLGFLEEEA